MRRTVPNGGGDDPVDAEHTKQASGTHFAPGVIRSSVTEMRRALGPNYPWAFLPGEQMVCLLSLLMGLLADMRPTKRCRNCEGRLARKKCLQPVSHLCDVGVRGHHGRSARLQEGRSTVSTAGQHRLNLLILAEESTEHDASMIRRRKLEQGDLVVVIWRSKGLSTRSTRQAKVLGAHFPGSGGLRKWLRAETRFWYALSLRSGSEWRALGWLVALSLCSV
ncbi:hypothetical protein NUW54_g11245 [Trametes sanguinea]|uniref:Uncharacterized protein n=1 Tax=Trametes sanguinea TaxID=158606 RepID=A0ACC1NJM5_9APHY|nr:hypothetical protein NUW54_g11245 [Trametes sanguinea]